MNKEKFMFDFEKELIVVILNSYKLSLLEIII